MTIAAGLMCSDGIVVCSDTEHTDYVAKYQREKIFRYQTDLMLTGAGRSDFIQMAFDKLMETYRASRPENPFRARQTVEELVLGIHREHIFQFYQPDDQQRPSLDLIVAIRCADGQLALIKTVETAALLAPFYEAVGSGRPLFEYWTHLLYRPQITINLMSYLCIFILREVKRNAEGCGGFSFIAAIASDPARKCEMVSVAEDSALAGFPETLAPILTECRDLRVDEREFQAKLEHFVAGIRAIRQGEWALHNAKKLLADKLPLPDTSLGVPDPWSEEKNKTKPSDAQKSEPEP